MPMILSGTEGGFFPSWTTATRPASPAVGQMGYNTTTGLFDQYTAGGWVGSLTNASQSIPKAALPTGSVIQVVNATSTSSFSTSSGSFVTTGFSATITPTSSTSKILILFTASDFTQPGNYYPGLTFFRGATQLGSTPMSSLYSSGGVTINCPTAIVYLDSPSTTSSTAYTLYMRNGNNNGTVQLNNNSFQMSIVLMEVAA